MITHSKVCMPAVGGSYVLTLHLIANGPKFYLHCKRFAVRPVKDHYQLNISGFDSVGLTDPFSSHDFNNMKFSTADQDNDLSFGNCALGEGGWWLRRCSHIELNNDHNNTKLLLNGQ